MSKVLKVVIYPDNVLRKNCEKVVEFDSELKKLAHDMAETMYAYRGIGLAASQVAALKRIFVLDTTWTERELDSSDEEAPKKSKKAAKKNPRFFVNPEILNADGDISFEEGCLSIPKVYGEVDRKETISVRYQDLEGKAHSEELEGLDAIAFQHELDHLNGVLFFDHMSAYKRRVLLEKFLKQQLELQKESKTDKKKSEDS